MRFLKGKFFTRKRVLLLAAVVSLVLLAIPIYVQNKVRSATFAAVEDVQKTEFAIVLGAAIQDDNQPGSYLKHRLDDVLELFQAGKIEKILLSGDNGEDAHDEISVMNNYLTQRGIPQSIIYGDYAGFDTYSSMERADKIFGIDEAIIVSQGFHLPRALYIAGQKGIRATGYASQADYGKNKYFLRENLAIVKSFFDCLFNRKARHYGKKVSTAAGSNIEMSQLEMKPKPTPQ